MIVPLDTLKCSLRKEYLLGGLFGFFQTFHQHVLRRTVPLSLPAPMSGCFFSAVIFISAHAHLSIIEISYKPLEKGSATQLRGSISLLILHYDTYFSYRGKACILPFTMVPHLHGSTLTCFFYCYGPSLETCHFADDYLSNKGAKVDIGVGGINQPMLGF